MKKNAFTLIELLAVITIIAIIALIIMPKANDALEKSKKNTSKTSAISYTKIVDDYILKEKMNKSKITLNGTYNIDEHGYLYDDDYIYKIDFKGIKPTNGQLIYEQNDLKRGCITINNYKTSFEDGEVTNTEKGECEYQKIPSKEEKYLALVNNYIREIETMYSPSVISNQTDLSKKTEKLVGVQKPSGLDDKSWVYFTYDDNNENATITDYSLKFEEGPYIIVINKVNGVTTTDIISEALLPQKIPAPREFATDPWETIISNVEANNTSVYKVGDTKKIRIDGTEYTIRIANKATPSECYTEGFSQTACGFVIEFVDCITTYQMNTTSTNIGGYPASAMHTYITETLFPKLPEILQESIIDTYTVSGHGANESVDFTSIEKLYLLAPKEIGDGEGDSYETSGGKTRILDYYVNGGDTLKCVEGNCWDTRDWWYRSPYKNDNASFIYIGTYTSTAEKIRSVAPAFRIGNQTQ